MDSIQRILDWLLGLKLEGWLGISGFVISLVTLYKSFTENKVKLDANIGYYDKDTTLNIYNNSSRKVTVISFSLYSVNRRWFWPRKKYISTFYDEGETPHFTINPYEYVVIKFSEQYAISREWVLSKGIYIKIQVSGKSINPIRLTV